MIAPGRVWICTFCGYNPPLFPKLLLEMLLFQGTAWRRDLGIFFFSPKSIKPISLSLKVFTPRIWTIKEENHQSSETRGLGTSKSCIIYTHGVCPLQAFKTPGCYYQEIRCLCIEIKTAIRAVVSGALSTVRHSTCQVHCIISGRGSGRKYHCPHFIYMRKWGLRYIKKPPEIIDVRVQSRN